MKIKNPTIQRLGSVLATSAINGWMSTLDYGVSYYDPTVDPVHSAYHGQKIYIFWHEYILYPLYMRTHGNLAMLVSQHRDAEILSYTAKRLGFELVRGSTTRGGVAALRELVRCSQGMNLAITPDGPRGPRRQLAMGPVYLSSKLGLPLVAIGMGYHNPWRLRSWDRFAIPRPYSRARAVVSPAMQIPGKLDRQGLEVYRKQVEGVLNRLCDDAQQWATVGGAKEGEQPLIKQRMDRRRHQRHATVAQPHTTTVSGVAKSAHRAM